jgi:hypothetical protein
LAIITSAALVENTTGSNNVGVGFEAGATRDGSRISGSNNTLLGAASLLGVGSISYATAIGTDAVVADGNTMVLGCIAGINDCPATVSVGTGTTAPDMLLSVNGGADKPGGGPWATFSDLRLKTVSGSFGLGLDQVMQLRPIRYRRKPDNGMGIRDMDEHVGLVAQEVQRVIPEAVTENNKGYLLVNNDPIIWSMVNAIKEQQKEIEGQRKLIRAQGAINQEQAKLLSAQSAVNREQAKQLRAQSQAMRSLTAEVRENRKTLQIVKAQNASNQPVLIAAK